LQDPRAVPSAQLQKLLQKFLRRGECETRPPELNLFKSAELAHSFKWRLVGKRGQAPPARGVPPAPPLPLTAGGVGSPRRAARTESAPRTRSSPNPHTLLARGDELLARGAYTEAVECYQELLQLEPRHAVACNNLGAALYRLGQWRAAEVQFRHAIAIRASYP